MALKSTVFKFQLQIADLDRHYYADHALTLARHPSETDVRLVSRVLAFACRADARLSMTSALCDPDEPDLCLASLDGRIEHWIDVGQPDARRIIKAAGRADRVTVHPYAGSSSQLWWQGVQRELTRLRKLEVIAFPEPEVKALAALGGAHHRLADHRAGWRVGGVRRARLRERRTGHLAGDRLGSVLSVRGRPDL